MSFSTRDQNAHCPAVGILITIVALGVINVMKHHIFATNVMGFV